MSTLEDGTDYEGYLSRVQGRFMVSLKNGSPLFDTRAADDLFGIYLDAVPQQDRQHHTCNACKRFLTHYGGLVVISVNGTISSAIWNEADAPAYYAPAVKAMREHVEASVVSGAFFSKDAILGTPLTGEWRHYAVVQPTQMIHRSLTESPFQRTARHTEEYQTIWRALLDFSIEHLRAAVTLLKSESLYRSERVLGPAQWLLELQEAVQATDSRKRNNVVHRAVALAPSAFCHPRSGMIGTLLEDIAAGMDFEQVKRRFAEKMNPTNYQRAQAAPAAGAIQQAEKLFEQLGLAPALDRRYAHLDELPVNALLWNPVAAQVKHIREGGVFQHLHAKPEVVPVDLAVPVVTITWDKFQRTVLPTAHTLEVQVPQSPDRFMALVTSANTSAPPILQWDSEEDPNPFSWYYASGIDAEIRRRLVQAGGKFENVELRCSLMWNNRNDLDLHAFTPKGQHISYINKRACSYGGWLDVDMNVRGETDTPVENIRWDRAPEGRFIFYVNLYATHGGPVRTPFTVEVQVAGQVYTFHGETTRSNSMNGRAWMTPVTNFHFDRGRPVVIAGAARPAASGVNAWGLTAGTYAQVRAIVKSPNLWGKTPQPHHGQHAFFLLEGCEDAQEGVGRGLFTEMLRPDLRPVRSVLEAHIASTPIQDAIQPAACGIGISNAATGELVVRATGMTGRAVYKIDRWD